MMMLFLGSGVSVPSGLPRVAALMDGILSEGWFKHTDQLFCPGSVPNSHLGDPTTAVQQFLKYLKGTIDASHARRGIDPANYEDLFFVLQQIADQERGEQRNAATEPFLDSLRTIVDQFDVNQGHLPFGLSRLASFAIMGMGLIQAVVKAKLSTSKPPVGLGLISELARKAPITVVTLNHDLLIEAQLDSDKIPYANGFGALDGDVRWFESSNLSAGGSTRILKPHGSINWYLARKKSDVSGGPRTMMVNGDPLHCKTAAGESISNWGGEPLFLTGVGNKVDSYNMGIFAEMFFRFHEALHATDTVVMSGYGWGDKGVNTRLVDWLFASGQNRLVLLHAHPEEFLTRLTPLTHRRDWLLKERRLIEIRKWMTNVTVPELEQALKGPP